MASAIIGRSLERVNAPENRSVGQLSMVRQIRRYGLAGIHDSIPENGRGSRSVQKGGVLSL